MTIFVAYYHDWKWRWFASHYSFGERMKCNECEWMVPRLNPWIYVDSK